MCVCAQVGGLGDVVSGLAKACLERGHHVQVVIPMYESLDIKQVMIKGRHWCTHPRLGPGRAHTCTQGARCSAGRGQAQVLAGSTARGTWRLAAACACVEGVGRGGSRRSLSRLVARGDCAQIEGFKHEADIDVPKGYVWDGEMRVGE